MIPISKPLLGKEEKEAVLRVLDSGMLVQGAIAEEFEKKFAELCNVKHAVAVNNGTAALHASLYAMDIKEGDEVITTPFTFVATANSILMQKAKPVFADINKDTFNIDPESVKKKITKKTKAILPVDLYGQMYDSQEIKEIAGKHNLLILEDACQAVNAEIDGKKAGSISDITAFSFYATKNMVTGEGGMITTNNENYAERIRSFRNHGQGKERYDYKEMGYNYRMTDIQAAIGLEQLKKLEKFTEKRIKNASFLSKHLKKISWIEVPFVKKNAKHVFHQYTIKVDRDRDKIIEHMKKNGIMCGVYYPKPLHLYRSFTKLGYKEGDFPVAEKVSKQVISLPVHPALKKEELKKIVEVLANFKY